MRAPQWVVPVLVALCAGLGLGAGKLVAVPSVVQELAPETGNPLRTTVFVVDGVRCVDTAAGAARQLVGLPGAVHFTAYASRNRVEIRYDPAATSPAALREALEGPVYDEASGEYHFRVYGVVEMDGVKVERP